MNEPFAVDTWIYTTLKADSTLTALIGGATTPRIYNTLPPQETTPVYPMVLFQLQSAVDLMGVGPTTIWADMLYLVRGLHETTSYGGNLLTIAERIDTALHAAVSASNAYGVVQNCVREYPFRLPEVRDGRNFRYFGGMYRIRASKG